MDSVGGSLNITYADSLSSLSGLNNLISIGGDIRITKNVALVNLEGLNNLNSIGGNFVIGDQSFNENGNSSLNSLMGVEDLTFIGGDLSIAYNILLEDITSLANLSTIGGDLTITNNDLLTSLEGLDNINGESINALTITNNPSLSNCEVQSICSYLGSPNGVIIIYNNAPGCNSSGEIAYNCGLSSFCLPYGNYYFYTQAEIDNFQIYYPDCSILEGLVVIDGNDIDNLNGLNAVTKIVSDFFIGNYDDGGNPSLTSLTGLDNVSSIGGDLYIFNDNVLTNLMGLENVISIGGTLNIIGDSSLSGLEGLENVNSIGGTLNIYGNTALVSISSLSNVFSFGSASVTLSDNTLLESLTGLENIDTIGGVLHINGNSSLTDLSGLDNVSYIKYDLRIAYNDSLTSLTGLDKLTYVGKEQGYPKKPGYKSINIENNSLLTTLTGLNSLTHISGALTILNNNSLVSLSGIDNINDWGKEAYIQGNPSLSICEVQSICEALANDSKEIYINNNAPGCNNIPEVETACETVGVPNVNADPEFTIYPNPAKDFLNVKSLNSTTIDKITIYNIKGQKVLIETNNTDKIDLSVFERGLYIIEIVGGDLIARKKLFLQ